MAKKSNLNRLGWTLVTAIAAISAPVQAAEVATLQDVFTDKSWSFYWNGDGKINDIEAYSPLIATNQGEDATVQHTAIETQPEWLFIGYISAGASPTFAGRIGGLPGPGIEQSASQGLPRAAIFAYQVPEDGEYFIENSSLTNATDSVDGMQIDVILGNSPDSLLTRVTDPGMGGSIKFDVLLGVLNKGEKIYLAVSPRQNNYADIFAIDCDIVKK